MARRFWEGEFARLWFGFRNDRRVRKPTPPAPTGPGEADTEPLGIVERNRRARRGKWALRSTR